MPTPRPCRIVHIDDNPMDIELMQMALDEADGRAVAYTGMTDPTEGAARLADRRDPPPSIVILDLNMPVTDGAQILERLRRDHGLDGMHVFVLTTSSDPADRKRCLSLGATAVMTKPSTFGELVDVARFILSHC
jgi:CheY-like chemotaxis protein